MILGRCSNLSGHKPEQPALSQPVWAGCSQGALESSLFSLQVFHFHLCVYCSKSWDVKWKLHLSQKGSFSTLLFPAGWALDQVEQRLCDHCGKEPARNFPWPLDVISLVDKLLLIPVGISWMMLLLHPGGYPCLRTPWLKAPAEAQLHYGHLAERAGRRSSA